MVLNFLFLKQNSDAEWLKMGENLLEGKTRPIAISCMLRANSDQPTDQWTNKAAYRVTCTQLKTNQNPVGICYNSWQRINKAVDPTISDACGWAGAVKSMQASKQKNLFKKFMQLTNQLMNIPTDIASYRTLCT